MSLEVNYLMRCCGVKEINGLSWHNTPKEAMLGFCGKIYPTPAAVRELWTSTITRAKEDGVDAYHTPGYLGASATGLVHEDQGQYSRFRFAIFTEANTLEAIREGYKGRQHEYGRWFAKLIEDEKLGSLVSTKEHELNPNSGYYVKVWVWGIDHDALKAWYAKQMGVSSWEQKPMSAVLGGAAAAVNLSGSLQAGCGTTIVSAGSVPISNNAQPTSESNLRAFSRW